MPFSLSSYLLGVGTVVGALTFGFGGGVLLTRTAMNDTSTAPTRIERVTRAEPSSAPQAEEANTTPARPVEPAPPPQTESMPQVQGSGAEPARPVAEISREAQPPKAAESSTPQTESAKPAEPKEVEVRKAEERKIERQKRYAERKARGVAAVRAKPHPLEEQQEPSRPELAFEREEPQFNLFEIPLFGRSREILPVDRGH